MGLLRCVKMLSQKLILYTHYSTSRLCIFVIETVTREFMLW